MTQGKPARSRRRASTARSCPPATTGCTSSRKGQTLRIVDLEGNQAADTLFYNAARSRRALQRADTIREQGNIYLTTGTRSCPIAAGRC